MLQTAQNAIFLVPGKTIIQFGSSLPRNLLPNIGKRGGYLAKLQLLLAPELPYLSGTRLSAWHRAIAAASIVLYNSAKLRNCAFHVSQFLAVSPVSPFLHYYNYFYNTISIYQWGGGKKKILKMSR